MDIDFKQFSGLSSRAVLTILEEEEDQDTLDPSMLEITLIDEILGEFKQQFSIPSLLSKVQSFVGDVGIHYKFKGVKYDGCLSDFRTMSSNGQFHHQLTIRLSSDGFRYSSPERKDVSAIIRSHKSMSNPRGIPGYHVMKASFIENMKNLAAIQHECGGDTIKFFYNPKHRRIDIEFIDSNGQIPLKIDFEFGSPTDTNKKEWEIDLFGLQQGKV